MKPVDIESQNQTNDKIIPIKPYGLLSLILMGLDVVLDVVFFPVILYVMVNSIIKFSNPLEFLFTLLLIITKYSCIGLQVYGILFVTDKKKRDVLSGVVVLQMISMVLMFVSWTVMLLIKDATILMVITDPILYYLMFGILLSVPGLIELHYD